MIKFSHEYETWNGICTILNILPVLHNSIRIDHQVQELIAQNSYILDRTDHKTHRPAQAQSACMQSAMLHVVKHVFHLRNRIKLLSKQCPNFSF